MMSIWHPVEDTRYPMRRPPLVKFDDVDIRYERTPVGQVVAKMILSEEIIHNHRHIAARALETAVDEMGKVAAYAHEHEIQAAVDAVLRDHEWIKPIIEREIQRATREFILSVLGQAVERNSNG